MRPLLLLLSLALSAQAQITMDWMASWTTWNTEFAGLQSPGWILPGHPGGLIGLQWRSGYIELGGDPHRPREATSVFVGLRHDLWHKGRLALYGQVSAGMLEAPSFLEYCGSYEYMNGDCGAGSKLPEYCPWFSLNGGGGIRVRLGKKFWLEPARAEYFGVYGVGPRFRFLSGFRVGL